MCDRGNINDFMVRISLMVDPETGIFAFDEVVVGTFYGVEGGDTEGGGIV